MPEIGSSITDGVIHAIRYAKVMSGDVDECQIELSSRLSDGPLSMDSLDYVAMMVSLEEQFGIIASDEDFSQESVATVGDVVEVVRRLVEAGAA